MAGVFEYFAKERLAETDLGAPLPQAQVPLSSSLSREVVETAAKEEEATRKE